MFAVQDNVGIEAIAAACMKNKTKIINRLKFLDEKKVSRLTKGTGFTELSIAPPEICTSDFCFEAAKQLLFNVDKNDIGALIFVSQTADYLTPATSYYLQARLGLPKDIVAFDVNLGCSGFVYGVYLSGMFANNLGKKVLLCAGDTSSRNAYPDDTSMLSITADAGAAAIIGHQLGNRLSVNIESYGERADCLLVARGGARANRITDQDGMLVNTIENYCNMDGMVVTNFSFTDVPRNIKDLLSQVQIAKPSVAYVHQGNKIIVSTLAEHLGMSCEEVPFNAQQIGNTSSASIPLVISELKRQGKYKPKKNVLLCGFGVGLSVASMVTDMDTTAVFPTIEL